MRITLSVLVSLISFTAYSQSGRIYQDVFSSFFTNMALVNPSYVPQDGNVELMSYYKFRQGLLSDVSTFMASGHKVWRKENAPDHLARLIFFNEKEGPFISSSRAYGNYAVKEHLSSEVDISGGASLGLAGINFSTPSAAGSLTVLDGNIGLGFNYRKISAGMAAIQAFNAQGTVTSGKVRFERFYNMHFSAEKTVSENLDLKSYFLWRSLPSLPDQYIGALTFFYGGFLEAGALYFRPRGVSYLGTIILNQENNPLSILMTYNTSFLGSNPLWGNSFEIGLKYNINKQ
ncbi:MAG: type IX secretion system membrane protein PorP/SprF [Sporocytophaga sp.]|uniref:type IX secretion system membrane protein PorP/SprF n=1 Tax=Sporocytophaga sp. TaxID=2231183 RepID=UPI001B1A40AE|nr:type IX secretion system membrane protein PorP/SprF [Sporocytophaga sp.]MBO9701396.1 type IX secretion system membrane protein PorP/SprF [Sporocytophaga sp.]